IVRLRDGLAREPIGGLPGRRRCRLVGGGRRPLRRPGGLVVGFGHTPLVPAHASSRTPQAPPGRVDRATARRERGRSDAPRSPPAPVTVFAPFAETCDDRSVTTTILIVGEALTDIVVDIDGARREHPGGSPMNVAVALSRLGHGAHPLTRIGEAAPGGPSRAPPASSGAP